MEVYDSAIEMRTPRTLTCTHVLCTECITKMAKMSPRKIISCPFKCEDKTDCSKGLPKKSFVLLEVIGKGPYRQKLNEYYQWIRC